MLSSARAAHLWTPSRSLANTAPIPIIKNEELILLRAEARYQSGDVAGALSDINVVRVSSGGLAPLTGFANATAFGPAPGCNFLSYEDAQSIAAKGAYARRNGLGGTIIWNIGEGYVPEQVGQENALLEAVNNAFVPTH